MHYRGFTNISSDCFIYVPTHPSFPPSILQHFLRDILPPQLTVWGEDTAQNQELRAAVADTSFAVAFLGPGACRQPPGEAADVDGFGQPWVESRHGSPCDYDQVTPTLVLLLINFSFLICKKAVTVRGI